MKKQNEKKLYDLSEERLISSTQTDMAYKYFGGLFPKEEVIDSSPLVKFRMVLRKAAMKTFLVDFQLNLYEHQSTWNPIMPLRNLSYVAKEY